MIKKMFAIKDVKMNIYMEPWFRRDVPLAIRDFRQIANDDKNQINQYPQDFELWELGQLDDETGEFKSPSKHCLCQATSVVRKIEEANEQQ